MAILRTHRVFGLLALGGLLSGCGHDDKGELALARLRHQPAAGFVRAVNLTDAPVELRSGNHPLVASILPNAVSNFATIGAGKRKLKIGDSDLDVLIESGKGSSILFFPKGKIEVIPGEVRHPVGTANVRLVFSPGDGSMALPAAPAIDGPTKVPAGHAAGTITLDAGQYAVGSESVQVEPKYSYTFVFVPLQRKLKSFLILNTPNQAPVSAGASGT